MSIENETWRDASSSEESSGAGRDGNQLNREEGYNRPSYNRENGDRPYRPRFSNENGDHPQRTYNSNRSYRPCFSPNRENGGRPQRSYGNNAGGDCPYRPRYNSEGGGRPQRSYGSSTGGDRPYRPRYNSEGGDRPRRSYGSNAGGDRPYRPRYNSEGGDRPQRPYGNNVGGDRPYRPHYNGEGGNRPQRSYGNNAGGDRPCRPRYNDEDGDHSQRPHGNRDSYSRPICHAADYDPNAKYSKRRQIEYKEQFVDLNEPVRLDKFLANAGMCSRREADEFITTDVVSMNGGVVTELSMKVKRGDEVRFHDQIISIEHKIHILLNKPKGMMTTSDGPQACRVIVDLVKSVCNECIYPVGRLDHNTMDALLLTNDGDLASKLAHPRYLKKRIYHMHLDKNLTKTDMERIVAGIQLDDGEIQVDVINCADDFKKDEMDIKIHSGKNCIVHRIFESLGYKVIRLDRVFFVSLIKKGLHHGE